ncbi:hypothetical protein [Nocardiopsis halotolerans]|uniref:hypothetical protein n=1 Tax=Nocardiopsis halotolerans TaxID=124252 RepID=UPI000345F1BA|nr:hypothetical protein [Nocardiopsis halotolerans]
MNRFPRALAPLAAVAVATPSLVAFTPVSNHAHPGQPEHTDVPYTCQTWLNGEQLDVNGYERGFEVSAPATVGPGDMYVTEFDPDPIYAEPAYNEELVDVHVTYALPANARIIGYWLLGSEPTDSVSREGDELTVHSPGAKPGGVEFDLPTLKVLLRAPGSGTLVTSPGGSSYDDLSFGWLRLHPDSQEWDAFECFVEPDDGIEFSSTEVTGR